MMRRMLGTMRKCPRMTALMFAVLLVPWIGLELYLSAETVRNPVRIGFVIGLVSYPVLYLIYTLSIQQSAGMALAGIGLSFLAKIVIVTVSAIVLWGIWKVRLLYSMPPLFYSLLSLNFFAIYFARQ